MMTHLAKPVKECSVSYITKWNALTKYSLNVQSVQVTLTSALSEEVANSPFIGPNPAIFAMMTSVPALFSKTLRAPSRRWTIYRDVRKYVTNV